MTQVEVDKVDGPEKPFKVPSEPVERQEVDPNLAAALLEEPEEPEEKTPQEKADEEGKTVVDNYSQEIQETSEELYGTYLLKAKDDPDFLKTLAESDDKTKRKFATKILERNDEFGASTIDDYLQKVKVKVKVDETEDPTAKRLVEVEAKVESNENQLAKDRWESWKRTRQVEEGSDFDSLLDEIKSSHPTMGENDVMILAKGRQGGIPAQTKEESSTVAGAGSPVQEDDDVLSSPLASKLLKDPIKETKQFARDYLVKGKI